jgi:HSP20 family protein
MLTLDLTPDRFVSSAWREMARLQNEMNSLFSRFEPRTNVFPAVNLWTSEDGAVVTSELPGVDLNDLDISVVGDALTIRGSRNPGQLQ